MISDAILACDVVMLMLLNFGLSLAIRVCDDMILCGGFTIIADIL